jgi:ABC-2 type transport system ATP-binding protein
MSHQPAPVQLARLHGADARGARGRPLGRLHGLTMLLRPAVHAFIGHPQDGSIALAELLAGRRRPRAGAVLVAGREPYRSITTRSRIGSLLDRPELPPCTTVARVVDWVQRLRGRTGDHDPLESWGLSSWRPRALASLRRDEARAVELMLAMATPDPLAMVLYEPFRELAGIDHDRLRHELSTRAADGSCVVLLSDSVLEIADVADHLHHLQRGRLLVDGEAPGWPDTAGGELLLWLDGDDRDAAIALAGALGARAELRAVGWRQHGERGALVVSVHASNLDGAALAVAQTVEAMGVRVAALEASGSAAAVAERDAP